jgi:hypothetical protein
MAEDFVKSDFGEGVGGSMFSEFLIEIGFLRMRFIYLPLLCFHDEFI